MTTHQRKPRILIAEDMPDLLMILIDLLEMEGYSVHTTSDGQGAWDYLQASSRKPDIIISDIMMPRLNGIDLLKKVREDERFSHIPFMIYSASPHFKKEVESHNACFINKPFDLNKLMETIQKVFNHECNENKERLCDGTQNLPTK